MQDKISLAGDLGSGKSTVSALLIEMLGAEYYSTGSIVRSIAERMNMSVVELNSYMETHPEIDTEIDNGLRALSSDPRLLIIDSRMAWHFTEGTFKVYLSTDIGTSALRIMSANRKGEHAASLEETIRDTRRRRQSEQKRYSEMYGVDIKDLKNYDLVVDTTYVSPEEVAKVIAASFLAWQTDRTKRFCYLCPERINYSDDAPNEDKLARLISGEDTPDKDIFVFESEGEFYADSAPEQIIAAAAGADPYVSVVLTDGSANGRTYVKMTNSL